MCAGEESVWECRVLLCVCVCVCVPPYHLELFDFCISLCALCAKHSKNFCMNNKVEKAEKSGARYQGNNNNCQASARTTRAMKI